MAATRRSEDVADPGRRARRADVERWWPERPSYTRDDLLTAARKLAPGIRAASDEIERGRSLTEPIVQALADAGLYRMFLPRSLGGGEVDPLTYFDVVEELTRADSAVGWSMLISTSTMTSTARALRDEVLVAAVHARRGARSWAARRPPRGRAVPAPGGYRLTGRWTPGQQCPDRGLVPRRLPSLGG